MRQFREAVRYDDEESLTFLGLRQWSESIDCQGFAGSSCPEYSKEVRPLSELHAVLRTVRIVADSFVYITGHLRPVIRFADMSMRSEPSRSTIWKISGSFGWFRRRRPPLPSKKCLSRLRDFRERKIRQKSSVDWASSNSSFVKRTGTSAIEESRPSSWLVRKGHFEYVEIFVEHVVYRFIVIRRVVVSMVLLEISEESFVIG